MVSLYDGWVQNVVVALVVFCCPGFFNALGGIGGAGQDDPNISTAANAALYTTFAIFGYFGGFFFNILGPKILLSVGGVLYAFYATGMYMSGEVNNMEWFAILSGAVLGFGAGWLWTAQGAMTLSYATESRIGTYVGVFWVIFNMGGVVGGLIAFGLNYSNPSGKANPVTYFVFIGVMCMGSVLSLILVMPPSKVRRSDGSSVQFERAADCVAELKDVSMVMFRKEMLLLALLFFQSNFFYAYEFNGINMSMFSIRARSLNSSIYWGSQMLGSWSFGQLLMDNQKLGNKRRRALFGLIFSMSLVAVTWLLAIVLTYAGEGGYEGKRSAGGFGYCNSCLNPDLVFDADCDSNEEECCETNCIDIDQPKRYIFPIITFMLMGIGDAVVQTFSYWIMGAIGGGDPKLVSRFTGYYKGIQSFGAAISWAIDRPTVAYRVQLWINVALFIITIPPTYLATTMIPEQDRCDEKSEEIDVDPKSEVSREEADDGKADDYVAGTPEEKEAVAY